MSALFRQALLARGWSQAALEEATNLSGNQVYRADAGKHEPETKHILALIAALEIPPATMLAAIEGDTAAVEDYITLLAAESAGEGTTGSAESAGHHEQGEQRSVTRRATD